MGEATSKKGTIRGWHGLLGDESRKVRIIVFLAVLVLSISMTILQFGFVGIGSDVEYSAYIMALLGPIACVALLLGKGWATLEGILSGVILYVHAKVLPLDIVERYLVSIASSVILFGIAGLMLGLLFAVALRNNPQGARRVVYLVICCGIVSLFATASFVVLGVAHVYVLESHESAFALVSTGAPEVQLVCDLILMLVVCLLSDRAVSWYKEAKSFVDVRTLFRIRLIAALCLAFVITSAVAFVIITIQAAGACRDQIYGDLEYLKTQVERMEKTEETIINNPEFEKLSEETREEIKSSFDYAAIFDGYDMTDGTILVIDNEKIGYSYNPSYKMDQTIGECFGLSSPEALDRMAENKEMREMLYYDDSGNVQLSYMGAMKPFEGYNSLYVTFAKPFYMVYGSRSSMMFWTSLIVMVLLIIVYILADRLLRGIVVEPINRTNQSLALITDGNLDVLATEAGSIEFSMLSAGINTTVDALKRLIDEAKRRNEQDLATARAIQEGALPKEFPAFPRVESVKLYASMNAAREVGGDFYDFFEVDDTRVGFLIADVSGKGIPGALFMMAAKNEIENRMLSGMGLAEAVSTANVHLCANNEAGMFVTLWAATFDWTKGELTYVNAGHNFPLLRHGRGGNWEWLKKKCGLFLGTFEIAKYRQETIDLQPGDELILYTDGVNEAFSVNEEEYGNDRLEAFLAAHNDMRHDELVKALRDDVAAWAEGAEQSDDITILVMEYGVDA
ncbi:MAG: SpoIIE family protein phosphatase [Atopobiaceae bacterium]|nr:SpoIIE family protein phosphatase [Atopobiaceae bacterium]